MPTFELTISDKALQRLQASVDKFNENTGQNLTVKQWLIRHLKEMAIGQDFGAAVDQLKKDNEAAHQAAIRAKFEELIKGLGDE